jgi:hypothetical protein
MVTVEHAATISRSIPDGRLAVIPGEHSLPIDSPALTAGVVVEFLTHVQSSA